MLKISGLHKGFGGLEVIGGLDLRVDDGEIVALVGPSGCGKTTLLNIVAGFLRPDAGGVDLAGVRVGYVFQEDRLLPWLTVEENVRVVGDADDGEAVELLALAGLGEFAGYYPAALSGGMRQRCSICRAYNYHCDLLLMDEPFKSLDHILRLDMLEMLMNIRRRRRNAVLFVTHDLDEALAVAARLVVLSARPATILCEFDLGGVETPRDVCAPELVELKRRAIAVLRENSK